MTASSTLEPDAPAASERWRPSTAAGAQSLRAGRRERMKERLLGPVLPNEALAHERLGRPTALAVFSSDALSSTAYATEEILRTLLAGGVGFVAFGRVMPITIAMVVVLAILLFSYRQTIKHYPSAGGAYIVTKDNLGLMPAQVAGVALLTDYVLTVAVSVSAGTAALYSAVPATHAWRVPIAVVFIALIAWGNLRGVKESGKLFAAPTYCFIASIVVIIVVGIVKQLTGHLHATAAAEIPVATKGVGLFLLLHAFASGGAAMTGVEAISNGVPAFRKPEWRNARSTLMIMGTLLGVMFLGLSWLASKMHTVPSDEKTVISQIAKGVLGGGPAFFLVQLFTLLILVLAANTSFADFPRLASFHAEDAFMPRQLTKRGHRLAFSNGILFLAVSAAFLVVLFGADVTHLIPLYAIGVFTSFTLSQAGMARKHLTDREPRWPLGLAINGTGALATGVVTVVIAITKFTHGAWAIMLLVPLLVAALVRLNRQYTSEETELGGEHLEAALNATVPARHVAIVLVDKLDASAARALQAAHMLRADTTEAVHFALDEHRAERLMRDWAKVRLERIDLRVVACPDRRLTQRAQDHLLDLVSERDTHVTVLIPQLMHKEGWHSILHDRTSNELAVALAKIRNVNVTLVPYQLGGETAVVTRRPTAAESDAVLANGNGKGHDAEVTTIRSLEWRRPGQVIGRVEELAVERVSGTATMVAVLKDATGSVDLVFVGRPVVKGLELGAVVRAGGTVVGHRRRTAFLNPIYEIVVAAPHQQASPLEATHH